MNLQEFAQLLEDLEGGQELSVPFNLHSGIRVLGDTTPDLHSRSKDGFGFLAWARFFREIEAATVEAPLASAAGGQG
jgi:hypothetical protein